MNKKDEKDEKNEKNENDERNEQNDDECCRLKMNKVMMNIIVLR